MSVADVALVAHRRPGREATARLLDRVDDLFRRYVAFPNAESRWAVVAWVLHTWALAAFESTPRLALLSPEKGSGKTRVLEVLELVVPEPLHTVNISASALFRKVDAGPVTLLLDEADTYLGLTVAKEHEDIRGLVNAGHRRGANVLRSEVSGKKVTVQTLAAFAPVALAGIGDLPDTIIDRSIVVAMKRRAADEPIESFRFRKAKEQTNPLADALELWASDWTDELTDYEPEMPPGITDRPADVWEPIVAIGDHAGGEWSDRLRHACVTLNAARAQRDPSLGVRLLNDVRAVFVMGEDRLSTAQLLERLTGLDEAPWGDLRGKALDARGLARRLRPYDVRPGDHRFDDGTKKGYLREDFHDAWARYLPPVALTEDGLGDGVTPNASTCLSPGSAVGNKGNEGDSLFDEELWAAEVAAL